MILHSVIFTLGNLEVFSKKDISINQDIPGIFWRDHVCLHGIGPFPSIHQAMENYTIAIKQRRNNIILFPQVPKKEELGVTGNIIKVDFVTKRRIS